MIKIIPFIQISAQEKLWMDHSAIGSRVKTDFSLSWYKETQNNQSVTKNNSIKVKADQSARLMLKKEKTIKNPWKFPLKIK